jgi:hypothetical protein
MTEAEWQACGDPRPMQQALWGKVSDRKLRLFAVACCRGISQLMTNETSRRTVEIAEQFADGLATDQERSHARKLVLCVAETRETTGTPTAPKWERRAASAAYYAVAGEAAKAGLSASELVVEALIWREGGHNECDWEAIRTTEWLRQTGHLRDIFGSPSRPVAFPPSWRTDTAVSLAARMYESRDFSAMPILADALQDAGCDSDDILNHCHGSGPHVRGCWVMDAVLGKE